MLVQVQVLVHLLLLQLTTLNGELYGNILHSSNLGAKMISIFGLYPKKTEAIILEPAWLLFLSIIQLNKMELCIYPI